MSLVSHWKVTKVAISEPCQHFSSAFIYIKSFFVLSWMMEIFSHHTDDSRLLAPVSGALERPGRDAGTVTLSCRQIVQTGSTTSLRSPALLSLYLEYLILPASDS